MKYEDIIKKGLEVGLSEIELYESTKIQNQITYFQSKVNTYTLSNTKTLSMRGKYNGQMGYASTEDFTEEGINKCLNYLLVNAKYLSTTDADFMFEGNAEYVEVENPKADYEEVAFEDKVQFLANLENRLLNFDKRVVNVELDYIETGSKVKLINSYGVNLEKEYSYMIFYAQVVAQEGDQTASKFEAGVNTKFNELDADEVYNKITKDVINNLGAGFVETGKYPIILNRDVASSILGAFSSVFSGESAMRKLSILTDKVNTKVFGENITIINDPFTDKALFKEAFDDEGVPCQTIEVVKDGIFTGFLHNLRSANYFKQNPTGNGFRRGASTTPSPINLHLQEGNYSEDEMISTIDKGLLITAAHGLHAGLNPISGNFNVQSQGFLIENGKLTKPVTLFVLSSNFYEMFNNVEMIGNNTEKNFNGVASPSIKIKEVQISGK